MSEGRAFHAEGPAFEKERSQNLDRIWGRAKLAEVADLSPEQEQAVVTVTVFLQYFYSAAVPISLWFSSSVTIRRCLHVRSRSSGSQKGGHARVSSVWWSTRRPATLTTGTRRWDARCTTSTWRDGSDTSPSTSSTSSAPRTLWPTRPKNSRRWRGFSDSVTNWPLTCSISTELAASTACALTSAADSRTPTDRSSVTESVCRPAKAVPIRR